MSSVATLHDATSHAAHDAHHEHITMRLLLPNMYLARIIKQLPNNFW